MSETIDVRIAPNGRMVLPRAAREALGLTGAGVVVVSLDGNDVRLTSMRESLLQAQALYRANSTNALSTDDFLKNRRDEALQEQSEDLKS